MIILRPELILLMCVKNIPPAFGSGGYQQFFCVLISDPDHRKGIGTHLITLSILGLLQLVTYCGLLAAPFDGLVVTIFLQILIISLTW